MKKHIAFLKAINVGGHTVKMSHLKKLFENMGFSNVATFIASGNVVFDTTSKSVDVDRNKIEIELEKSLGYKVPTFLRTITELKEISEYKPFKDSDLNNTNYSLYIAFLNSSASKESIVKTNTLQNKFNEFHFSKDVMYWICKKKFSDSGITGNKLEKTLGMKTTVRNSTTIKKIVSRFS